MWSKKWALASSWWVWCKSHKCHCLTIGPKSYGACRGCYSYTIVVIPPAGCYRGPSRELLLLKCCLKSAATKLEWFCKLVITYEFSNLLPSTSTSSSTYQGNYHLHYHHIHTGEMIIIFSFQRCWFALVANLVIRHQLAFVNWCIFKWWYLCRETN